MALFITPWLSAFGQNVRPSDGAKLYFYEAGTSTPKTVYSDPGLTTPHSNPVVATAEGRFPTIFLTGTFKVVLTDKNDVTQETEDDLAATDSGLNWKGDFDSTTNGGDYPASGVQGDVYRVTEKFTLNPASGSHQLYLYDFIIANKDGASDVDADWNIIKGKDWLIDEDDFASDDDTLAPSQQSVKGYIDTYAKMAPDWTAGRVYAIGDYVRASDFKIYRALVSQSGNDPSGGGDPVNWLPFGDLLNALTSTDTTRALTAAQGKVLKDAQDILAAGTAPLATISATGFSYLFKRIICSPGAGAPLTSIDTTAGNFKFSDGSGSASIGAFTKTLSGGSWVQGTGQQGRASGVTYTAGYTYHYFALSNTDGSVVDFGFDTDIAAANLLADANVIAAGLTKYARQMSVLVDSTPNIIPFKQEDKKFTWDSQVSDVDYTGNLPTVRTNFPLTLPNGFSIIALLDIYWFRPTTAASTNDAIILTDPARTDQTPSIGPNDIFTLRMISGSSTFSLVNQYVEIGVQPRAFPTFLTPILGFNSVNGTFNYDFNINTLGWVDYLLED